MRACRPYATHGGPRRDATRRDAHESVAAIMIGRRPDRIRLLLTGWALALCLALALGQQHAMLHWLGHAIDAAQAQSKHFSNDAPCDECAGLASLGAGLACACALLPLSYAHLACPARAVPAAPAIPVRLAYLSRAPPRPR